MAAAGADRVELLGELLYALRHRGVAIGPRELNRLRTVFERTPRLDYRQLRALLRSVLVKHPKERDIFEPLFEAWCPDSDAQWPEPAPRELSAQTPEASSEAAPDRLGVAPEPRLPWWRASIAQAAVGIAVAVIVVVLMWPPTVIVVPPPESPPHQPTEVESPSGELPSNPTDQVWYWQASIDRDAVEIRMLASPWRLFLLGLIALGLAAFLLVRYWRLYPAIKAKPSGEAGSAWHPLPELALGTVVPRAQRQRALWQLERFRSEDPTPRLDIPRTVRATAEAGGFVCIHYEAAAYERGVQFWWDRQLDAPTVRAAAGELATTLQAGGIDFNEGFFFDVPHRIDGTRGRGFRPVNEEGAGREAVVAIFLDGDGLEKQLAHPLRRRAAERLLRDLSHWPRLCFVDCSASGRKLRKLFRRKRLHVETIRPEALAEWMAGEAIRGEHVVRSGETRRDDWILAAALAMGGVPATQGAGFQLRQFLGVSVETFRVDGIARRINTEPDGNAALINRLLRCEPLDAEGLLHPRSRARLAIDWWRQRYRRADRDQTHAESRLLPWSGSPSQQNWNLESALLQLYLEPQRAAEALRELGAADRQVLRSIRTRLSAYCADDDPRPGADSQHLIRFTWRFAALPLQTKHTLLALGFQFPTARALTPLPPALALASSALAGLGSIAIAAALWFWLFPAPPKLDHPQRHRDERLAEATLRLVEERPKFDKHVMVVGSARAPYASFEAAPGTTVPVSWSWKAWRNEQELGESVVWRAGTLPQPIRACGGEWPKRSLLVIEADKEDVGARQLAIRLLDLGTADQVLIGPDWAAQLGAWMGASPTLNRQSQLLVVTSSSTAEGAAVESALPEAALPWALYATADFGVLAGQLIFKKPDYNARLRGVQPIESIERDALPWQRLAGAGNVYFYGGPELKMDDSGIRWAEICPGTYSRGVFKAERIESPFGDLYNPPAHTVFVSGFDMATTETTEAQYAALFPGQSSDKPSETPVVDLDWDRASDACQQAGGRLPRDAEWEYAARGGSRTGWSFGDDEAALGRYAWYSGNARRLQSVAALEPNPLGLFDMHGNVWEWTGSQYVTYPDGGDLESVLLDPEDSGAGGRVVRGGSFVNPPGGLRSANRGDVVPEFWFDHLGFRCVRVPPQP